MVLDLLDVESHHRESRGTRHWLLDDKGASERGEREIAVSDDRE
jgi:hypothetical protein